jgi:hypothetical protein
MKSSIIIGVFTRRSHNRVPEYCRLSEERNLDVHESMHRDTIMKVTNKMQLYRLIYFYLSVLHVSGDVFVHHQEHLTVFTVSSSIHSGCCRLVSWMSCSSNLSMTPAGRNLGEYYQIL